MLGSVLGLTLPLLVWLTPDLRIKKSLLIFTSTSRHTRYWRDRSSDVCSSDLGPSGPRPRRRRAAGPAPGPPRASGSPSGRRRRSAPCAPAPRQIGRASCRERVKISVDAVSFTIPEINAWERAGADASSAGMVDAGFENQKELTNIYKHKPTYEVLA